MSRVSRSALTRRGERFFRMAMPTLTLALALGLIVASSCNKSKWSHLANASVLDHEFCSVREYTFVYDDGTQDAYKVAFESAGDSDRFSLELLELNGLTYAELSTDPDAREKFDTLSGHMGAGGAYRLLFQIGFRVRDFELLRRNYVLVAVEVVGGGLTGSGERSIQYLIGSRHGDRPSWRIWLSLEPGREGLLLGYEEFRLAAHREILISRMETLDLDYGSSNLASDPQEDLFVSREELDSVDEMALRADFPVYYASYIPAGFELIHVEESVFLTDATADQEEAELSMFRLVFSDGVETFEVFQNEPAALSATLSGVGFGGPPSLQLNVLSSIFLSIRQWSVPISLSEIAVEGRASTNRFQPILEGLRLVE